MNYNLLVKGLFAEAKRGLQFKDISLPYKILLIIGLSPLIVLTFSCALSFYVLLFFYRGLSSPLEYLHQIVKNEGQEVRHATQFIIYWIAFPFIFLLYIIQAFFTVVFYFMWFELMLYTYLVTLGGVKWQPFLMDANYEEENSIYELRPSIVNMKSFIILLTASYGYLILGAILINKTSIVLLIGLVGVLLLLFIINPILFKIKAIESEEVFETNRIESSNSKVATIIWASILGVSALAVLVFSLIPLLSGIGKSSSIKSTQIYLNSAMMLEVEESKYFYCSFEATRTGYYYLSVQNTQLTGVNNEDTDEDISFSLYGNTNSSKTYRFYVDETGEYNLKLFARGTDVVILLSNYN